MLHDKGKKSSEKKRVEQKPANQRKKGKNVLGLVTSNVI